MKALNGIIDKAEFYSSPNCDSRPDNIDIDLFVIHAISLPPGDYNTQLIKDLFLNNLDLFRHRLVHPNQYNFLGIPNLSNQIVLVHNPCFLRVF